MNDHKTKTSESVVDGRIEIACFPVLGAVETLSMEKRSAPSPGLDWENFDESAVTDFWHRSHGTLETKRVILQEKKRQWLSNNPEE